MRTLDFMDSMQINTCMPSWPVCKNEVSIALQAQFEWYQRTYEFQMSLG